MESLFKIGRRMGNDLSKKLDSSKAYCVASTAEDADFLTKGVIDGLKSTVKSVYLACFWNDRLSVNGNSVAPIYNKYLEEGCENSESLIVVSSEIADPCVVKTNITALLESIEPAEIIILAPFMNKDFKDNLEKEFPLKVSAIFDILNDAGVLYI